jgi:hypothetical protein
VLEILVRKMGLWEQGIIIKIVYSARQKCLCGKKNIGNITISSENANHIFSYCGVYSSACESYTEPLPSNDTGYTCKHRLMEGIVKYAVEIGSGAVVHIRSFKKVGSGIDNLIRG